MDEWTHPRHSASGNAVSQDRLVAPPRRVRWLAGPWEEVANVVTIGGRNFYGAMLARDGFNGLRLWQRNVATASPHVFRFRPDRGNAAPVTGADRIYVYSEGVLQAFDAATGKTVQQYPEAGRPQHVLFDQGVLVTVDPGAVRCLDAESGRPLWRHTAADPRHVVAGDAMVALIQGNPRRGETCEVVVLDQRTGQVRWRRGDLPWAPRASRSVYHRGMLTFEVSTLNDDGPNNSIHIVSASNGEVIREVTFLPGMNHMRQSRAMFVEDQLWLLQGGRGADKEREPIQAVALDVATGQELARHPAGLAHCFPPVATPRFLFSGEMDLTDLQTGQVDANRITKAACGREAGWFPAHGLIYVTPKHCVCWPMLRGYAALAPARPGGNPALQPVSQLKFVTQHGVEPPTDAPAQHQDDWPMYRHDAWRSGSTLGAGPEQLEILWRSDLRHAPDVSESPILADWDEDPYIKGPVSAPVVAGDTLVVSRPHAHQVLALDTDTGQERWLFTANGRVDTPPTIHRSLCLFGTTTGWVYCLRLEDGALVWRLRAAPLEERIVAYGQLESPWPVPGSVLVVEDVAYFAAGRQSFADGGILIFAIDPATGRRHWVERLDSVPQQGFYRSSGLEFDNFDLLHREGDDIAMSRWRFDRASGAMTADIWRAFARLNTGNGAAMVPQGCWSYAPRNQSRTKTFSPRRPLLVFRDRTLFGCAEDKQSIYRRDFQLEQGEEFETKWITGWENSNASRNGGVAWRSERLAEKATWTSELFGQDSGTVAALALASNALYAISSQGMVGSIDKTTGRFEGQGTIPPPLWDGLAIAGGRLYVTTEGGQLLCLGRRE
jgi:outer membrane protein assembly factor BamB